MLERGGAQPAFVVIALGRGRSVWGLLPPQAASLGPLGRWLLWGVKKGTWDHDHVTSGDWACARLPWASG